MDLALEEGTLDCRDACETVARALRCLFLAGMDASFGLVDLGNSCCLTDGFGGTFEHLLEREY